MHLYIALTPPRCPTDSAFHWALVTAAASSRTPTGIVNTYQITHTGGSDSSQPGGAQQPQWTLAHDRARLSDALTPSPIGCICLSTHITSEPPPAGVDAFLREFPAAQGRYRTDGGARWSCARWVVRCLESLVEAGIIVGLDMRTLCESVEERGRQLGARSGVLAFVDDVPIVAL